MPVYLWQQESAWNATADPSINLAVGRSPSSVTPADRATLAAIAQWRDDVSGSILSTGTSNAYILATNSVFDTAAHLNDQMICFVPHTTNTQGSPDVTITIDSIANIPIRTAPNTPLLSGVLVAGTPYTATYNNTDGALYLHGYFGQQSIPLGASLEFWGTTSPYSNLALMFGQAISRTTYAPLFAMFGTTYGAGDGSTTFNIPDARGRVVAGVDNMGGTAAGRLTSASGMGTGQLGQAGGTETRTLVTANLPPYTPQGSIANGAITISHNANLQNGDSATGGGAYPVTASAAATIYASQGASTFTGSAQGGTSTPVPNVMPTIVANRLLRIA